MASLPPGWEPDYDGSRWLYRYKPTGLTQFRFPKPGDEFPEFVAPGAGPIVLAPEERLASEKQIKLRREGAPKAEKVSNDLEEDGRKDEDIARMSATGYFDPSEYMYYEGAEDDGELTPIVGQGGSRPRYPLGFVAELPSSDTVLCADELAPVELFAGPYETSPAEELDGSSATRTMPVSASSPTNLKALDVNDVHSSGTPSQLQQPSPIVAVGPPVIGGMPYDGINSSARPVATEQFQPQEPRFSFTPIPRPTFNLPAETKKPASSSKSQKAVAAVPLVLPSSASHPVQRTLTPGRSVDDIQAMPSSLEAHEPPINRKRSKSAIYVPWRPMIKFVQAGTMQESQVSTPASSGPPVLEQKDKNLIPAKDRRMSAWLSDQAHGRPLSQIKSASRPDPTSSEQLHPEASRQHQKPKQRASDVVTEAVNTPSFLSPLPLARRSQWDLPAGQGDRVVESIIEIPPMEDFTTSRGVQLVDISPGLPKSWISRRGAVKEKRFSWESEADDADNEVAEERTAAKDSTASASMEPAVAQVHVHRSSLNVPAINGVDTVEGPPPGGLTDSTEASSPSVAHNGRPGHVAVRPTSRSSPLPSPRLPFEYGTVSPSHGRIEANKVVLVEPAEERKASIATFEAGPHKPLPPLPLAPKGHETPKMTPKQPTHHAFEQISEMIAVANAAMPSARPLSALPPGPTAESVWRSLRTQASGSALSPGLPDTLSGAPSTMALNLPSRLGDHSRSISQLDVLKTGMAPPGRHHRRSQSLIPLSRTSPAQSHAFNDVDRSSQALVDTETARPKPEVMPAASHGHKSHRRLSVHLTPAGTFRYHPLRSSPVLTMAVDAAEPDEPQPVDYVEEQTPSALQLKSNRDQAAESARAQRPRLQVKLPFIGLPKSPRPSSKHQPVPQQEQMEELGPDEGNEASVKYESITVGIACHVTQRRLSMQSQVSSPTSSIFSSMRDSSVSAISSMADTDSTPLSDLVVGMAKKRAQHVEQHGQLMYTSRGEASDQMRTKAADIQAVPSPLSPSPTPPDLAGASFQRPQNLSEAIRPAGTRASKWGAAKREEDLIDQALVPIVVVRAPTVKTRTPARQETQDPEPIVPPIPKLPPAASDSGVLISTDHAGTPAQPVADTVQSNDHIEQQPARPAKQQGFIQSLRNSWQTTTNNSRLSLLAGQGHTRSRSHSTLPEPQGKVAETIAMIKQQVVMPWQWTKRDSWPDRESVSIDTGSISNVGAAIGFFNSTFQARRPDSRPVGQKVSEVSRSDFRPDTRTSTIVMRRVGPPVVVRMPL